MNLSHLSRSELLALAQAVSVAEQRGVLGAIAGTGGEGTDAFRTFQTKYRNDPAGFSRDCIIWKAGEGLSPYQNEAIMLLPERRRLSVRGAHGLGKTTLAAIVILWFALTRDGQDWKIPTTASAWRQLTKFLWPEVHKWARRIRWDVVGREPFNPRTELLGEKLKLSTGEAFGMASDNAALIEGAHADNLLFVFDESKTIPAPTWDAVEGAFSTGECYWLAISTPGEPSGRFYEIQSRRPGFEDWTVRHVTLEETIAAGRISQAWADARRRQWGEKSAVYQNRVLGNFASSDEDSVIPLTLIEQANERYLSWVERGRPGEIRAVGVDVARGGEDMSVLAPVVEEETETGKLRIIAELERHAKEDTMQTTGRALALLARYARREQNGVTVISPIRPKIVVDVIGIGAGVVDRLREQGHLVVAFNASEGTKVMDASGILSFLNKRSAAWWALRDLLAAGEIALPPDDRLTGDLTAPRWKVTSGGKVQVEGKDDIRSRIGRSTDDGDAVVMALWKEGAGWLMR